MNKFEKALADIIHNTMPYNHEPDRVEHDRTIIEALKKQIPKLPAKVEVSEGITIEVCPVCNKPLNHMMVYCSGCGQLLDWSDNDD